MMYKELTDKDIERQDCIHNAIYELTNDLAGRTLPWNIEYIGEISDHVEQYINWGTGLVGDSDPVTIGENRTAQPDDSETKLRALCEGLEVGNIDYFMKYAGSEDYRGLGETMTLRMKDIIEERDCHLQELNMLRAGQSYSSPETEL